MTADHPPEVPERGGEAIQPGDRVRIVAFPEQPQTVGEIVTVVEVTKNTWPVEVRFDGRKYPNSCLHFDEVARV